MHEAAHTDRVNTLITGCSEMAARIRAHSWSKTPLGRVEGWSETLLTTVNLMLHSPFPTILSWGPEMVFLYNDAAISTLTTKHPNALGSLYHDVFHEAWDLVRADLEACLYRGETAVRDNIFIPILINGVLENHYFKLFLNFLFMRTAASEVFTTLFARRPRSWWESETSRKRGQAEAGYRGCETGSLCLGRCGRQRKLGK